MVVNNNAAATLLMLAGLAEGGEVVVSRGQLVEIGGSFRIPDIMRVSGARLVEVGTTNKTRVSDYRAAVTSDTALLLRVHTSNFKIMGFAEETPVEELVAVGREWGIPVADDLGSGALAPLEVFRDEPSVSASLRAGADVVSFSGDKLLGGPPGGHPDWERGRHRALEVASPGAGREGGQDDLGGPGRHASALPRPCSGGCRHPHPALPRAHGRGHPESGRPSNGGAQRPHGGLGPRGRHLGGAEHGAGRRRRVAALGAAVSCGGRAATGRLGRAAGGSTTRSTAAGGGARSPRLTAPRCAGSGAGGTALGGRERRLGSGSHRRPRCGWRVRRRLRWRVSPAARPGTSGSVAGASGSASGPAGSAASASDPAPDAAPDAR